MKKDEQVIYKLKCISAISLMFMIVEILGGIMANSIAILADAFHLLSDVLAYIISLQAVLMSHKKAPFFMTFGYEKIQPLGALINIAIIWFVTIQLVIEATQRIVNKSVVQDPLYMLLTSFFGLGCNLYIMKVLHSDTEHGGHQGCSHAHGLQHHHDHKQDSGCSHHHDHGHDHNHNHHNHDHTKKQILEQKQLQKKKCSHNHHQHNHHNHDHHDHDHDHDHHDHNHDHDHDHHDHDHDHQGHHHEKAERVHSPTDSARQINCDMNHDHFLDSNNCRSTSTLMSRQNQQMNVVQHVSYKPEIEVNLSDQNFDISEKQRARKQLFENINIQAAHIHIISDIILSIGVIISALIIFFNADPKNWTFWQLADPFCTYMFSIMAIYSTVGIAKDSVVILLDGCDAPDMLKDIIGELDSMDQIQRYEQLRVWSLNRAKFAGAIKIYLSRDNYEDLKARDDIRNKVISIFSIRKISYYVEVIQEEDHLEKELKPLAAQII